MKFIEGVAWKRRMKGEMVMKKTVLNGIGVAVLAALASPAFAADSYKVDPLHAWVTFKISHAGFSNAHGIFRKVDGSLAIDKTDPSKSSVSISLDANSVDTNYNQRNSDIKTPDFLNVAEFPTITFKSTKVEKTGDKQANVTGDMTIAGVTKPVVLAVTFNKEGQFDPQTYKIGFSATGKISLADFKQKKALSYGLGPDLALDIDVEAIKN